MGAGASKDEKSKNANTSSDSGSSPKNDEESGKRSFEVTKEIFAKHVSLYPSQTQVLSHTFNLFDISQTNTITATDLQKFFEMVLDENVTEVEVEKMIAKVTDGKSKEISYEQFEDFMREDNDYLFRYKTFTMGSSTDASASAALRKMESSAQSDTSSLKKGGSASDLTTLKQRNIITAKSMNKKLTKFEQENDNLRKAFDIFDFSERGQVSLSDLIDLMKMMGIEMSPEEVAALFGIVGRKRHVDFTQFCEIYQSAGGGI
uniref:EF-hand domain-containing protein n=1 Tax=Percolomonas cosmopolitus TaxID=63605 RepID=A0A7S1KR21_9EUKA|mmetsp:Transcript_5235/g.19591  ORF Transcript_5235/g.19591 Transcript_5235/m.19591 type:complete len:261 (+) Transcript_5235:288-1070(+)|eukprot:CAMPEP_0117443340 /NCGR_PEP_ID=MMETSP0759-20121206/4645_1 /TAXON_ID=63605 /ORGANISM="Percolomonas cosmopolitus, Strain WS" /LENGTH=260 /DNA_ID=CAMNT_0005235313 /DNA_START=251 /DNA_END=1033 /DNA_ORIENTATION=+